jgi:acid phosphatase
VELFVLDTTPLVGRAGDPDQLAWLRAGLAASTARWKVVVGHHPIRSRSVRGDNQQLLARLEPLLLEGKADLYLAGHDHVLELMRPVQGVHYVVSGGAAGPAAAYPVDWTDDCLYAATGGGFACLRFGRDECVLEFVRGDARTEFAHVLAKPPLLLGPY